MAGWLLTLCIPDFPATQLRPPHVLSVFLRQCVLWFITFLLLSRPDIYRADALNVPVTLP